MQEITYLTSTTTLNPLSATSFAAPNLPRPRKTLPDQLPTSILPRPPAPTDVPAPSLAAATSFELPPPHPITNFPSDPASAFVPLKRQISQPGTPSHRLVPPEPEKDYPPSSPSLSSDTPSFTPPTDVPAEELVGRRGSFSAPGAEGERVTAIFKPESSEAWQERLKRAGSGAEGEGEKRGEEADGREKVVEKFEGVEALEGLEWEDEKAEDEKVEDGQVWKAKKTLRR